MVDEIFARRYWPAGGALGQRLFTGTTLDDDEEPFTMVGVVGAVKQANLTEHTANGVIYFPFSRYFARNYFLVVRTGVAPEIARGTPCAASSAEIDPELPLNDLRSMEVAYRRHASWCGALPRSWPASSPPWPCCWPRSALTAS